MITPSPPVDLDMVVAANPVLVRPRASGIIKSGRRIIICGLTLELDFVRLSIRALQLFKTVLVAPASRPRPTGALSTVITSIAASISTTVSAGRAGGAVVAAEFQRAVHQWLERWSACGDYASVHLKTG